MKATSGTGWGRELEGDELIHIVSRPQTLSLCESVIYEKEKGTQESRLGTTNNV